jgi:hypothetical protein
MQQRANATAHEWQAGVLVCLWQVPGGDECVLRVPAAHVRRALLNALMQKNPLKRLSLRKAQEVVHPRTHACACSHTRALTRTHTQVDHRHTCEPHAYVRGSRCRQRVRRRGMRHARRYPLARAPTHPCACTHARTRSNMHARTHARMHTRTQTNTCARARVEHTHPHTHTRTHTRMHSTCMHSTRMHSTRTHARTQVTHTSTRACVVTAAVSERRRQTRTAVPTKYRGALV